jgi:hypothetical protein
VVRDRRLSDRKASAQPLTPDFGLRRDMFENLDPARVGERLRDSLELLSIHELRTPEAV